MKLVSLKYDYAFRELFSHEGIRKQFISDVPGDAVGEWIRLFNAEDSEELNMIKTGNAGILEAIEVLKEMSLSKRLRMMYEAHLKAVRDRWAEDEYVRRTGYAEGRNEGRIEGRNEGRIEGRIEGRTDGKAETLLLILESKGDVPENLRIRISSERNAEKLDEWIKQALSCVKAEEFASILECER